MLSDFLELDTLLTRLRGYWQLTPFTLADYPWRQEHPELCAFLDGVDEASLEPLDGDFFQRVSALQAYLPDAVRLYQLCQFSRAEGHSRQYPAWMSRHIPERKWQQITAFAAVLSEAPENWLDWCSGKGHLGRLLAYSSGGHALCLEHNADLCAEGLRLARDMPVDFIVSDVLDSATANHLLPGHHCVALHACGDLHTQLLRLGSQQGVKAITVAPCCYHLIRDNRYQPLSEAAGQSDLRLDRPALQRVSQELVTGGARINRLRQTEVLWRLAFDSLQRDQRGVDEYLTVPTIQKRLLSGHFEDFCRWAAEQRGVTLSGDIGWDHYLQRAEQRRSLIRRIELVQHLFRRPLEVWLVLDRALFLQEQGYEVSVNEFCARENTPRNLMIRARRR